MYNKHLDAFMSVVEKGSFSKAAEASHISRTALIQQINLLEDHLGFELFIRSSKGIKLTPMGELFRVKTREIMRLSADTISQCRALEDVRQIRIGTLPNLPLTILAPICMEYHRLYPSTEIVFVERQAEDYLASFQNNEFDISADYMSRLVLPDEEISFTWLSEDSFDCAVSPESPLSRQKGLPARAESRAGRGQYAPHNHREWEKHPPRRYKWLQPFSPDKLPARGCRVHPLPHERR